MNLLITYDMSMRVCVCECMCELSHSSFLLFTFANARSANENSSCPLRHHFARCQPLLHVVTEDRGDIDEH